MAGRGGPPKGPQPATKAPLIYATRAAVGLSQSQAGQSLDLSDLVPLESETEDSAAATRAPPLLGTVEPESAPATSPYPIIGNRKSHIYHRPDCPNYSQVAPHNRVAFNSAAEADAAGYRLAGNCSSDDRWRCP
jgi:Metal binding domain of Ada